ncbi:MAG: 6-bladed beta-propeller [Marinifilaceae bacterium]
MLLRTVFLFLLSTLLWSCGSTSSKKEVDGIIHVELNANLDNCRSVNLSALAEDIQYIPLETNDDSYLGRIRDVIVTDQFIFTHSSDAVMQFNRAGKFIRKVGAIGKGPGEYARVYHLSVNQELQRVYVSAGGRQKLVVYDFLGNYIEEFPVPDQPGMAFDWIDSTSFLLHVRNPQGEKEIKAISFGVELDSIKGFTNHERFTVHGNGVFWMIPDRYFYHYQNKLHFRKLYGDTIFTCASPTEMKPIYKLELGEKFIPVEKRIEYVEDMKRYQNYAGKYLNPIVYESEKWLFVSCMSFDYKGKIITGLYDKVNKEFYSVQTASGSYGLLNDLDGGQTFWPKRIYQDKYLCNWRNASAFKESFQKEDFQWGNAVSQQKQDELKELVSHVKSEDNPIVVVATLKSES